MPHPSSTFGGYSSTSSLNNEINYLTSYDENRTHTGLDTLKRVIRRIFSSPSVIILMTGALVTGAIISPIGVSVFPISSAMIIKKCTQACISMSLLLLIEMVLIGINEARE